MATAALFDMSLIAVDTAFRGRVQAAVYNYAIYTLAGQSSTNHQVLMNYAGQVLNNPGLYVPNFAWASASNQTLANDVITNGNAGANFTATTTAATVAAAIAAGATDSDIDNAVAAAWTTLANP